jgi:hypothetical protein
MNKCLAKSNKSRGGQEATKKRNSEEEVMPSIYRAWWGLRKRQKIAALLGVTAMVLLGLALDSARAQTTNFYDSRGNKTLSATTLPGGRTDFYDSRGRRVESSFRRGTQTDFYDARGRRIGSSYR